MCEVENFSHFCYAFHKSQLSSRKLFSSNSAGRSTNCDTREMKNPWSLSGGSTSRSEQKKNGGICRRFLYRLIMCRNCQNWWWIKAFRKAEKTGKASALSKPQIRKALNQKSLDGLWAFMPFQTRSAFLLLSIAFLVFQNDHDDRHDGHHKADVSPASHVRIQR